MDASYEEGSYSGLGGTVYNSAGVLMSFFSENIDPDFFRWGEKRESEKHHSGNGLALLIAVSTWCPAWNGFRVVAFTDSEAVPHSFVKTWSRNDPCSSLLKSIFEIEEVNLCPVWLERVPSPSQSNPVDFLFRGQVATWQGIGKVPIDIHKVWSCSVPSLSKCAAEVLATKPQ